MTDTNDRAFEAAWKACSSWDGKITKPVLRKAIEAYLRELTGNTEGIDPVGRIAQVIAGAIAGNCCHRTGGLNKDPQCECRDAAERLLEDFPAIAASLSHQDPRP